MPYYYNRREKKRRDDTKELEKNPRVKVTKKTNYVAKLDTIFSKYIRLRDCMVGGFTKCISCGRIMDFSHFDAGHYYSRTHMSTRFDEDNVHSECSSCNRFSAEHLIGYRENLIRKIGEQRFMLLGVKAHQTHHYDEVELKALIEHYKKEVKRLSREKDVTIR